MFNLPAALGLQVPHSGAVSYITSIQQVSIAIGNETSHTATINSVDTSKAFIIFQGATCAHTTGSNAIDRPRVELTNGTTVTAYRNTADAQGLTVNAVVIEGNSSLIASIQKGTITITAGTTNTATITAVDTTRAAVFHLGNTTTTTTATPTLGQSGITLTNSTTVTANIGATGTLTVGYVVVEFQAAVIQSVQQFANAYTTSNTTDTQTITSVTANNSMIARGGQLCPSSNWARVYALQLTSATNVNLVRGSTSTTSRTPYYTVIEFKSGILNSAVQRGIITLGNGVTSNTATISSISTTKGFANYPGFNFSAVDTTDNSDVFTNITQTNATTITATRNTGSTDSAGAAYEAIEFVA